MHQRSIVKINNEKIISFKKNKKLGGISDKIKFTQEHYRRQSFIKYAKRATAFALVEIISFQNNKETYANFLNC